MRAAIFLAILMAATPALAAQCGIASFYGAKFHGRKTASGERFNMHAMTCAHRTARFGTRIAVTDSRTGREITCRVNDRGPFVKGRVIDLSRAAAAKLGILQRGVARVCLS